MLNEALRLAHENGYQRGYFDCRHNRIDRNAFPILETVRDLVNDGLCADRESARALVERIAKQAFKINFCSYEVPDSEVESALLKPYENQI